MRIFKLIATLVFLSTLCHAQVPGGVYTFSTVNILQYFQANGNSGLAGQCVVSGGPSAPWHWGACGSGGGGVTLTAPSVFTVTGSGSSALGLTFAVGQPASQFLATPNGISGPVSLRSIVPADIPTLNQNTTGQAGTALQFASTPILCPTGQAPVGILPNGNATGCAPISSNAINLSLTVPSYLAVTGSPYTGGTGSLGIVGVSQAAKSFLASPNATAGVLAPRLILPSDIPILNQSTTGNAGTATQFATTPNSCPTPQFAIGVAANGNAICSTPLGGIPSINGVTGPITLTAGTNMTIPLVGSTFTFNATSAAGAGNVTSEAAYANGCYEVAGTTIGTCGGSTFPSGLTGSQMQTAINGLSTSSPGTMIGPEPPFTNTSNYPVEDLQPGHSVWQATASGVSCDAILAFGTVTSGSNVLNITSGYSFVAADADSTTPKWISIVGLVGGVPTRFDAYVTSVISSTQVDLSTTSPFNATAYSITIGHDDTAALAQAVSYAHNGDLMLQFPGNPSTGSACWSRTAPLALSGTPMTGLPNGGILGGAGIDTTQGASGYIKDMTFYVDARIDATHAWSWNNNGTITSELAVYRPAGIMTPSSNNPLGPGWIRGSEPYGLGAYNGVASTNATAVMCVLTPSGTVPPVGADIVFPYMSTVFHTTVASTAGSCGTGTPITLSASAPDTVSQAEYFFGEAPGASASGTAVQEINTSIPASGRSFPMQINLKNPNNPEPGAESDFAPFGLVKIDAEQCQYFKTSSYPYVSGQWLDLTACAQNGTSAALHNVGAAIVPLNPFKPALPWPVTTINGTGNQTPATAEYYPAFNIGNAAIAQPLTSGTGFSGTGGFSSSHILRNTILAWPAMGGSGENAYQFQATNSTAGLYMVPLPFNSWFLENYISGPQFGIWEGIASTNTHDYMALPTADTDNFIDNHISGGYNIGLIGGGTLGYNGNQLFSQNGPPNSGWYPYTPAVATGGSVCMYFSAFGPDDTVGLPRGQYSWGSEVFNAHISGNNYCEYENPVGSLVGTQPGNVFDFNGSTWAGSSDIGGGTSYFAGTGNHISGGPFAQGSTMPAIIDGSQNIIDYTGSNLANVALNNTWGSSPILDWGAGNSVTGASVGGDHRLAYGTAQTAEFASTGNITKPYVNLQSGYFDASTLNPVSDAGTAIPWTFDGTSANISQGYAGCAVNTGVTTAQCTLFLNGRANVEPSVGPGQIFSAAQYIMTMSVRGGSSQNFGMYLANSCSGIFDSSRTTIPVTTSWVELSLGTVDFTSSNGCTISIAINGTSSSATNIEIGHIVFTPIPQNLTVQNANCLGICTGFGSGGSTVVQVNGSSLTSPTPVNFQSSASVTFTNPSAGIITATSSAGSAITALTGDITATGPGSVAGTLATVNSNIGSCGDATHVSQITLNAKGLATGCTPVSISGISNAFSSITSGTNTAAAMIIGSGASLGVTGSGTNAATSAPWSGLTGSVPTFNQSTTGTASNLSGTPALPNGTTATTQALGDGTTKLATDAFVIANAGGITGLTTGYIPKATSSTSVGNSHLDDGVTTAATLTATEALALNVAGGQGGTWLAKEGTAQAATSGYDILYADSTAHCLEYSTNGGSFACLGGGGGSLPTATAPGQILSSTAAGTTYAVQGQIFYSQSSDTIATIESECSSLCTYVVTIPQTLTLAANHALNANVQLDFKAGGKWTVNGAFTLTIPGGITGTLNQHFAGSSTMSLGAKQMFTPVEWFGAKGDGSTDDTIAIQAAINAATVGQVQLQCETYKVTSALTISKSNVGIKGCPASRGVPTVIQTTSASADEIDVAGTGTGAGLIAWNKIQDLSLTRTVLPTGTAKGLSINYVGGVCVQNIDVEDSITDFYVHASPGYGACGFQENNANFGYNLTETSGTYVGYELDSSDGLPSNSTYWRNNSSSTNNLSAITSYGFYSVGSHMNDIDNRDQESTEETFGIVLSYTGSDGGLGASDIHFYASITDGFFNTGIVIQNLPASENSKVEFNGGWVSSGSGTGSDLDISDSAGIQVSNMQFTGGGPVFAGIYATGSSGLIIANNNISTLQQYGIQFVSTVDSTISGNRVTGGPGTNGIDLSSSSNYNSVTGNAISGWTYALNFQTGVISNTGSYTNSFDSDTNTISDNDSQGRNSFYLTADQYQAGPLMTLNSGTTAAATVALTNTSTVGYPTILSTAVINYQGVNASNTTNWALGFAVPGSAATANPYFDVYGGSAWAEAWHVNAATSSTVFAKPPVLPTYTVSTLPSAATVGAGAEAVITDALTFTVGGSCTGGGSDTMIAVSNGTAWSCH